MYEAVAVFVFFKEANNGDSSYSIQNSINGQNIVVCGMLCLIKKFKHFIADFTALNIGESLEHFACATLASLIKDVSICIAELCISVTE